LRIPRNIHPVRTVAVGNSTCRRPVARSLESPQSRSCSNPRPADHRWVNYKKTTIPLTPWLGLRRSATTCASLFGRLAVSENPLTFLTK
jgi:hypothetical protein